MGFKVILDIVGSVIIGGILLIVLFNMKNANVGNNYKYLGNKILQGNLTALSEILDNDFKQIGYLRDLGYSPSPILLASRNRIQFLTDSDTNGVADVTEYYFNGADNSTPNPKDTVLKRIVSGTTSNLKFGVVGFKFTYKDISGNILTSTNTPEKCNLIRSIQVDIKLQSTFVFKRSGFTDDALYEQESTVWRRVFYRDKTRARN